MLRFWVLREKNSRFCSKTQWQMFLLVSGRHVGAHLGGHQHGVSIQISLNFGKTFLRISSIRKIAVTWILARVFAYLPSFYFQILDLTYWTVLIFYFDLFWMEWHWKPAIRSLALLSLQNIKERTLKNSAFFRMSSTMSASFDPKRRFLWKSVNPCNQPLGNHPMKTTNYLPNCQYVLFVVSVYQNQRKYRALKKSAFFCNSTILSCLWKSLNPTSQPLAITYERLITFNLSVSAFPRENTQEVGFLSQILNRFSELNRNGEFFEIAEP